ncbi:MAG: hypothetical protein HQK49_05625 [Oligoflexia bacterium]|nr:hypothetical protein [Oligoflexia bacterium]
MNFEKNRANLRLIMHRLIVFVSISILIVSANLFAFEVKTVKLGSVKAMNITVALDVDKIIENIKKMTDEELEKNYGRIKIRIDSPAYNEKIRVLSGTNYEPNIPMNFSNETCQLYIDPIHYNGLNIFFSPIPTNSGARTVVKAIDCINFFRDKIQNKKFSHDITYVDNVPGSWWPW